MPVLGVSAADKAKKQTFESEEREMLLRQIRSQADAGVIGPTHGEVEARQRMESSEREVAIAAVKKQRRGEKIKGYRETAAGVIGAIRGTKSFVPGKKMGKVSGSISSIRHELGLFQGKGDQGRGGQMSRFMVGDMGMSRKSSSNILLGGGDDRDMVDYDRIYRFELARGLALERRKELRAAATAQARERIQGSKERTAQDVLLGGVKIFDGLGSEEMDVYNRLVSGEQRISNGQRRGKRTVTRAIPPPLPRKNVDEVANNVLLGGGSRKKGKRNDSKPKPIRFI